MKSNVTTIVALTVAASLHFANAAHATPIRWEPGNDPPKKANWHAKIDLAIIRGMPWNHGALHWFADRAGLVYEPTSAPPDEVLRFVSPAAFGKPREFTLTETFDILNEMLQVTQRRVLVCHGTTLTTFHVNDEIPRALIPRVHPDRLTERPRTEIVETVISLRPGQIASKLVPHARILLDKWGYSEALPGNRIMVRGTVASICRAENLLRECQISFRKAIVQ